VAAQRSASNGRQATTAARRQASGDGASLRCESSRFQAVVNSWEERFQEKMRRILAASATVPGGPAR